MRNLTRLVTIKHGILNSDKHWHTYWLISIAFAVVIALEYLTPPQYVFGYLYTGTILLASYRLNRAAVFALTLASAGLTLLNLLIPHLEVTEPPTLANR